MPNQIAAYKGCTLLEQIEQRHAYSRFSATEAPDQSAHARQVISELRPGTTTRGVPSASRTMLSPRGRVAIAAKITEEVVDRLDGGVRVVDRWR